MTKTRALARARIELGPTAWVDQVKRDGTIRFRVGIADGIIPARQILGESDSWEESLERAIRDRQGIAVRLLRDELELLLNGEVEHVRPLLEHALKSLDYLDGIRDKGLG